MFDIWSFAPDNEHEYPSSPYFCNSNVFSSESAWAFEGRLHFRVFYWHAAGWQELRNAMTIIENVSQVANCIGLAANFWPSIFFSSISVVWSLEIREGEPA